MGVYKDKNFIYDMHNFSNYNKMIWFVSHLSMSIILSKSLSLIKFVENWKTAFYISLSLKEIFEW